jgi:aspartyl-tRNA(Asn)/glutamyl-tRNA(Gln) amidotransferase subunit B
MPPLTHEIKERLACHGLTPQDIDVLMAIDSKNEVRFDGQRSPGAVTYFEALAKGRNPKIVVNWCVILFVQWLGLRAQLTPITQLHDEG